jgi:hypothetical protein
MSLWAVASLVVRVINSEDLRANDSTLSLPFTFPGFMVPDNLGPIDLSSSNAWNSLLDVLYTEVGPFFLFDLVTLAFVIVGVMAVLPAAGGASRTIMRVALILGVIHVVMALNVAFFDTVSYNESGTYTVGAAVLAVGVVLTWWPFSSAKKTSPAAAPGPFVMPTVAPTMAPAMAPSMSPAAAPGAAPTPTPTPTPVAATPQYVVQTAGGMTDWLTWDQLVWMANNGQLQVTTLVYDGMSQVTMPAGSLPGLFPS